MVKPVECPYIRRSCIGCPNRRGDTLECMLGYHKEHTKNLTDFLAPEVKKREPKSEW
jgi:hypothetical protein